MHLRGINKFCPFGSNRQHGMNHLSVTVGVGLTALLALLVTQIYSSIGQNRESHSSRMSVNSLHFILSQALKHDYWEEKNYSSTDAKTISFGTTTYTVECTDQIPTQVSNSTKAELRNLIHQSCPAVSCPTGQLPQVRRNSSIYPPLGGRKSRSSTIAMAICVKTSLGTADPDPDLVRIDNIFGMVTANGKARVTVKTVNITKPNKFFELDPETLSIINSTN